LARRSPICKKLRVSLITLSVAQFFEAFSFEPSDSRKIFFRAREYPDYFNSNLRQVDLGLLTAQVVFFLSIDDLIINHSYQEGG